jgi:hypothetical protein
MSLRALVSLFSLVGVPLGPMVSTLSLRPCMADSSEMAGSPAAGSLLSSRKERIRESPKQSEIGCSWRLLIAGFVSQPGKHFCRMYVPETQPLILVTRWLHDRHWSRKMIDAFERFAVTVRYLEDLKASNWDNTLNTLSAEAGFGGYLSIWLPSRDDEEILA